MQDMPRIHRTYLCSFCGKNQDQVQHLIAGPKMVYVCDECIDRFSSEATSQTQQPPQTANTCSFCGKPQKKVQRLMLGPGGVNICNECVALCQEIIVA